MKSLAKKINLKNFMESIKHFISALTFKTLLLAFIHQFDNKQNLKEVSDERSCQEKYKGKV